MSKRKRDPSFATSEKMALIDLAEKYFQIIENKKTDTMSMKVKGEMWKKIEQEFNAISGIHPRDAAVLRNCWENLKKRAKQQQTQHNQSFIRTGGGPPMKNFEDPATERVLELIKSRVTGYINEFDSDGTLVLASSSTAIHNEDHIYECTNDTTNSESQKKPRVEDNVENVEVLETFTDWSQYTPNMLRDQINPALAISPNPSPDVQSYAPAQFCEAQDTSSPLRTQKSSSISRRRPALKRQQDLNSERLKTILITTDHAKEEHEIQMKILKLKEQQEIEILQQEKFKTEQEKIKLEILKLQFETLKK